MSFIRVACGQDYPGDIGQIRDRARLGMALLMRALVRVSVPVFDKPRLGGPQSDHSFELHRTIQVTEVTDVLRGPKRVGEAEASQP